MAERESTLGLGGFDAVSYFLEGRPRVGKFDHKLNHGGLTYCFFNQENLDKFKKNPEQYLPQFGGHCAFAAGVYGGKKKGDPQCWKIVEGKLYLNSNPVVGAIWQALPFLRGRGHSNYVPARR